MPPQQATTGPVPMEGIERTNAVVVKGAVIPPRQDSYAIEVDRGRNCYTCGSFGHMARHCRNWGQRGRVTKRRRLEYAEGRIERINKYLDNLKGVENLESLN